MTYLTTCLICGHELQPHAGHPQSAPWLCLTCHRGWFVRELASDARGAWRTSYLDFGYTLSWDILPGCVQEVQEAIKRGTSARLDQLTQLSKVELQSLTRRKLLPSFAQAVKQELKKRT